MSKDIAPQTQTAKPQLVGGGGVNAIVPQTADEAYRMAQLIVTSGMSPHGLDTPEKVTIAILQGIELGLTPMNAVQSIAVINNRPCLWGDGLIGVVRKSSVCEWIHEEIDGEADDMIAVCETQRKGEPKPVKRTFSVDDAKRAGLWQTSARITKRKKDGGTYEKDNDSPWWKYPKRMLQMRARALCLRDVYADVLKGMQVREEVEDYQGPDHAKDVTPPQKSGAERLAEARQAQEHQEPAQQEGFNPDHVSETIAQATAQEPEEDQEDESPTLDLEPADAAPPLDEGAKEMWDEAGAIDDTPAEQHLNERLVDYKAELDLCDTPEEVDNLTPMFADDINAMSKEDKASAKQMRMDAKARIEESGQ